MRDSENMMLELHKKMDQLGLPNVVPEVLSDAGNLIVRLHPYPIVARIAKLFDGALLLSWLRLARHRLLDLEFHFSD